MKKLVMLFSVLSLSIYAESFVKQGTGRHRQKDKLSQEEQVRVLSKCVQEIAELGETLLKNQQRLMKQIANIIENNVSVYTKETIKRVEEETEMLKLCQQKIVHSLSSTIIT